MANQILTKVDKWLKIILLLFANLIVISFTIASIVFLSMSDYQIKLAYPNFEMYQIVIQMKNAFKILIWFLLPITLLIFIINIWKIYEWNYQRINSKKNKRKKGVKNEYK